MQKDNEPSFSESFKRAWETVKSLVNKESMNVQSHSNNGVATPDRTPLSPQHQKEWNAKGQLEKLAGSVPLTTYEQSAIKRDAGHAKESKSLNGFSGKEAADKYEKDMERRAVKPMDYSKVQDHNGALGYTSSGQSTSISRVNADTDLHKRIENENKQRDLKAGGVLKELTHDRGHSL